jgi:hypothetical protein
MMGRTASRGAALALALLAAAAGAEEAFSPAAPPARLGAWAAGDWADPRVHRCGQVWVRIRIEEGRLVHYTVTFGNAVRGLSSEILAAEDGVARLWNERLGFEQRLRFVTRDAHVLERADGTGGVTFVRCDFAGDDAPES